MLTVTPRVAPTTTAKTGKKERKKNHTTPMRFVSDWKFSVPKNSHEDKDTH